MEEFHSHTFEEIIEAARQAFVWCDFAKDIKEPRSSLRTLEFGPAFFESNGFHVVNHIIHARKYKLESLKKNVSSSFSINNVMVYEPDSTVFDGLSESETEGFFDINDCPPWDTWIGFLNIKGHRYLLSWVPDGFEHYVNEGYEVNCVECFYWLKDSEEHWAKELLAYNKSNQPGEQITSGSI